MERWMGIGTFLITSVLAGGTFGQDAAQGEAVELRLEIARLKASLSECQERLEAIEKRLAPPLRPAEGAVASPQLALEGFCPVALVEEMRRCPAKWIQGQPDIVRVYDGLSYQFSSEAAARKFDRDPLQYALVMQGDDAVIAMGESRRVAGCREYGARWMDRTYVFASQESYEAFRNSPHKFAAFALDASSVQDNRDFWSATWSCFSRQRPIGAWIVSGLFDAYSSWTERDARPDAGSGPLSHDADQTEAAVTEDEVLPAGFFQRRLHLLVPADQSGGARPAISSTEH